MPGHSVQKEVEDVKDLHNYNCFLFLKSLLGHERYPNDFEGFFVAITPKLETFESKHSYSAMYSYLLSELEAKLDINSECKEYDKIIKAIFTNGGAFLEETFQNLNSGLQHPRKPYDKSHEELIRDEVKYHHTYSHHHQSPMDAGSKKGRLMTQVSDNYKPMLTTSLPSKLNFSWQDGETESPQQLRMGTQAQRHNGQYRISPLFKRFCQINDNEASNSNDTVSHVYFNLLPRDHGRRKRWLSEAHLADELHKLEDSQNSLIVISLPASKGRMGKHEYKKTDTKDALRVSEVFNQLLSIATGNSTEHIKDFDISPKAKQRLYKEGFFAEEAQVRLLLAESFDEMGFSMEHSNKKISPAQQQAVWFHFTKYTFPNFVLEKLKPKTWNVACRDAIDRGGVASAYYNLMKSIKLNKPLSRDDFEQALQAAAVIVKGRGVNHQINRIWNAIDTYITHNQDSIVENENLHWLIHWRNDYMPRARMRHHNTVESAKSQSISLIQKRGHAELKGIAIDILNNIGTYLRHKVHLKRPMLMLLNQVTEIATNLESEDAVISFDDALAEIEAFSKKSIYHMTVSTLSKVGLFRQKAESVKQLDVIKRVIKDCNSLQDKIKRINDLSRVGRGQ